MSNLSKINSGEDAKDYQPWRAPQVEDESPQAQARASEQIALPTVAQIEAIEKQAHEEGFADGRLQGIAAGEQQVRETVEHLEQILQALAQPMAAIDDEVEQEIVALAMAMTRQLLRRELKTDPDVILGVVREAFKVLPSATRDIVLKLHPEDAQRVSASLQNSTQEHSWRIEEDPQLSRGGCRVESPSTRVDASVESRLHAVIAVVLGDERSEETMP